MTNELAGWGHTRSVPLQIRRPAHSRAFSRRARAIEDDRSRARSLRSSGRLGDASTVLARSKMQLVERSRNLFYRVTAERRRRGSSLPDRTTGPLSSPRRAARAVRRADDAPGASPSSFASERPPSAVGVTSCPMTCQMTSQHSCGDASSNGTGGETTSPKLSPIAVWKSARHVPLAIRSFCSRSCPMSGDQEASY